MNNLAFDAAHAGPDTGQQELAAIGCNESHVHTDMMISSEEVSVEGVSHSGARSKLIEQGRWVL